MPAADQICRDGDGKTATQSALSSRCRRSEKWRDVDEFGEEGNMASGSEVTYGGKAARWWDDDGNSAKLL
ncbi:unnamed protein product [Linum trigynum]|uniref:Uncharacterized protein n=1 Tax=Linum trigynum TaxID=586398 RepID=A0AAV2D4N0_9ROSI